MNIYDKEFVEKITSIVPSENQLAWQEMEYYNFIHYGLNTYTGKEWGNGNVSPAKFNPGSLDTDQWASSLKSSGSKGIIITAKHHDGFCLFPSDYTDYSVASSPWKDGKGDIVADLAKSCKKYGLKLGIYLSPWDRHEPSYGTDEYNDFFCNQLTELCTRYGDIFMFWFDGACGEGKNGKKQVYDFERYFDLIKKYQPKAVTAICGRDVRWIGNESGDARESEWSVVPKYLTETEHTASISQQEDGGAFLKKRLESTAMDLGSRSVLLEAEELCWYPAEMDVSIYKRWFFHRFDAMFTLKTVEMLCNLYYESVGGNASLLLNVPVNKKGLIPKTAARRLKMFGDRISQEFKNPIPCVTNNKKEVYTLSFEPSKVSAIMLGEDLTKSQRVERFSIFATVNGTIRKLYDSTTIGHKKICKFVPVFTDNITVEVTSARGESFIKQIDAFI